MTPRSTSCRIAAAGLLAAALLGACSKTVTLEGTIVSNLGEPLVGVRVSLPEGRELAVTDGRGHYRVEKFPAGQKVMFQKSEHAGVDVLPVSGSPERATADAKLYRLLPGQGLYAVDGVQYRGLGTPTLMRQVNTDDDSERIWTWEIEGSELYVAVAPGDELEVYDNTGQDSEQALFRLSGTTVYGFHWSLEDPQSIRHEIVRNLAPVTVVEATPVGTLHRYRVHPGRYALAYAYRLTSTRENDEVLQLYDKAYLIEVKRPAAGSGHAAEAPITLKEVQI